MVFFRGLILAALLAGCAAPPPLLEAVSDHPTDIRIDLLRANAQKLPRTSSEALALVQKVERIGADLRNSPGSDCQSAYIPYQLLRQMFGGPQGDAPIDASLSQIEIYKGFCGLKFPLPRTKDSLAGFDTVIEAYSENPSPVFQNLTLQALIGKTLALLTFDPPHTGLAIEVSEKALTLADTLPNRDLEKLLALTLKVRALDIKQPGGTNETEALVTRGLDIADRLSRAQIADPVEIVPRQAELLVRSAEYWRAKGKQADARAALDRLIAAGTTASNDLTTRYFLVRGLLLRGTLNADSDPPRWAEAEADYRAARSLPAGETSIDFYALTHVARVQQARAAAKVSMTAVPDAKRDLEAMIQISTTSLNPVIQRWTAEAYITLADFDLMEQPPATEKARGRLRELERYANWTRSAEMKIFWSVALLKRAKTLRMDASTTPPEALTLYNRVEQLLPTAPQTRERDQLLVEGAIEYVEALLATVPPKREEARQLLARLEAMFTRTRPKWRNELLPEVWATQSRLDLM